MMITASQVIRQPDQEQDCGVYALLNLYRKMGLEPPSLDRLAEILAAPLETAAGALLPNGQMSLEAMVELLVKLPYPGAVHLGLMPNGTDARDCLPALVDAGLGVVVFFTVDIEGQRYTHASVVERCDADGMLLQCGVVGLNFTPYTTLPPDSQGFVLPVTYFQNCEWPFALWRKYLVVAPLRRPEARAIAAVSL